MTHKLTSEWAERFAWWPVRSSWSHKVIWLKKYHVFNFNYKNVISSTGKIIYTKNEFLLMNIINDENEF